MLDLTIAIPVKNEGHQIADCLKNIGNNFAKQIDIIDSYSDDNTVEIAKEHGANVYPTNSYDEFTKNIALDLKDGYLDSKLITIQDLNTYDTKMLVCSYKNTISLTSQRQNF